MNNRLYFLIATVLCVLCSACGLKEQSELNEQHDIVIVGDDYYSVGYQETILDIEIEANCSWSISKTNSVGDALSWIKTDVRNNSGAGSRSFRLLIEQNPTDEIRKGTVRIFSNQVSVYIDIEQDANPDPYVEPEPFRGYAIPAYQWFDGPSVSLSGNQVKCDGGLVIEKATGEDMTATYVEDGLLPGFSFELADGEEVIYKIPLTYPQSGDFRFIYGSRGSALETSDFLWSSDDGATWNQAVKAEATSIPSFKSVLISIPEESQIKAEHHLWIKMKEAVGNLSLVGGVALVRADAAMTSLPSEDNETFAITEGFDKTIGANASYLDAPYYMSSIAGDLWVSENAAITATECYVRPGFIQVGSYDEASPETGKTGALVLNVGMRLKEMDITESTKIYLSFKAAGITNALGEESDAQVVIKSGDEILAELTNLEAGRLDSFQFSLKEVDQNTVITITSIGTGADTRFFLDDIKVTVAPSGLLVLDFDFTNSKAMTDWATSKKPASDPDDIIKAKYNLNGEEYTFQLASAPDKTEWPYYNTSKTPSRVYLSAPSFLGLPAIKDYRLVEVSVYSVSSATPKNAAVTLRRQNSGDIKECPEGGDYKATNTEEWTTWELMGTSSDTVYWLYQSGAANDLEMTQLKLTYEPI